MRLIASYALLVACVAPEPPRAAMAPATAIGRSLPPPPVDPPAVTGPSGTVGGRPFESVSMYAFFDYEELHLAFSSMLDACDAGTRGYTRPGETRVTLQHLTSFEETPPQIGRLTTWAAHWARTSARCPPDATKEMEFTEAWSGFDTSTGNIAVVMAKKLGPDAVEGTIDITFDDGSRIKGAFVAPICKSKYAYEVTSCR